MFVFCIPAGGTNPFTSWTTKLDKEKKLVVLDIPGRGRKFREAPIKDIHTLVQYLIDDMFKINSQNEEYVLFGYCFGAILAYEMCKKMQKEGIQLPKNFIAFGTDAPNSKRLVENERNKTGSVEFEKMVSQFFTEESLGSAEEALRARREYIVAYGRRQNAAQPSAVELSDVFPNLSEDEEFERMQLMYLLNNSMVQIEQDDSMLKQYQLENQDFSVLAVPAIITYGAEDDFISRDKMFGWESFFEVSRFVEMPGDHYSIINYPNKFIEILNEI